MAALAGRRPVVDERDRVRAAGVLGQRVVVEVQPPRRRVERHVLEHRAEAAGRRMDARLGLGGKPDHLGVAPAFEVEHAPLGPPVLVVADEPAPRIARQRRLPRARQAEEQRRVVRSPDVRGTVHRQHAAQRQEVVHHREDRLLDLAGVAGAADQHEPLGQVQQDEDARAGPVRRGIRFDRGRVDHREPRRVIGVHLSRRPRQEHRAREQAVPGALGDDPDRQPILPVGAGETVLDEQVLAPQRLEHPPPDGGEPVRFDRPVDRAPPDVRLARRLAHDELVVRRTPGVRSGETDERPAFRHQAFGAPDRMLVQGRRAEVPVHVARLDNSVRFETRRARNRGCHVRWMDWFRKTARRRTKGES